MARALIVGCGCHGRELGRALRERGWRVRGTSRSEAGRALIEAAGLDAAVADPDRPGTILDLCGDVTVVIWLLGSAAGEGDLVAAAHGARLERLLEKLVDSPVRGFLYEHAGSVRSEHLERGGAIVERVGRIWRIPTAVLDEERSHPGWAGRAAGEVEGVLRA